MTYSYLIPLAVTVLAFAAAWGVVRFDRGYESGDLWNGMFYAVFGGVALMVSLVAWLVWALV